MGLDIRWPIGLMFSLIGAMLVIYGFAPAPTPSSTGARWTSTST